MLEELIGHLLVLVLRGVGFVWDFLSILDAGSRTLAENSRVGESPIEAQSRRRWDRFGSICFWLCLLLLGIVAALGLKTVAW